MALNNIQKFKNKCFLIITDYLSCLMALKSPETKNPIVLKLKQKMHTILSENIKLSFLWVPSYVGIEGNDMADELAKFSLSNKKNNRYGNTLLRFQTNYITALLREMAGLLEWTNFKQIACQPKLSNQTSLWLSRRDGVKYTRLVYLWCIFPSSIKICNISWCCFTYDSNMSKALFHLVSTCCFSLKNFCPLILCAAFNLFIDTVLDLKCPRFF